MFAVSVMSTRDFNVPFFCCAYTVEHASGVRAVLVTNLGSNKLRDKYADGCGWDVGWCWATVHLGQILCHCD